MQQPSDISFLDCCNNFQIGFAPFGLPSFQSVLYKAARMIFQRHRYEHLISPPCLEPLNKSLYLLLLVIKVCLIYIVHRLQ